MAHNETQIGALIRQGDEQGAADALIELLAAHGGNTVHAALACGVHHSTVKRWIRLLADAGWDVREVLTEIRETHQRPTMSSEERHRLELRNRAQRERARALAWLQRAPTHLLDRAASALGSTVQELRAIAAESEDVGSSRSRDLLTRLDVWRRSRPAVSPGCNSRRRPEK